VNGVIAYLDLQPPATGQFAENDAYVSQSENLGRGDEALNVQIADKVTRMVVFETEECLGLAQAAQSNEGQILAKASPYSLQIGLQLLQDPPAVGEPLSVHARPLSVISHICEPTEIVYHSRRTLSNVR